MTEHATKSARKKVDRDPNVISRALRGYRSMKKEPRMHAAVNTIMRPVDDSSAMWLNA